MLYMSFQLSHANYSTFYINNKSYNRHKIDESIIVAVKI